MKKSIALLVVGLLFILNGCVSQEPKSSVTEFTDTLGHSVTVSDPHRVVVASGSFAQVWLLAGGSLCGTTQDTFDDGFAISENTANIGGNHEPSLEQIIGLNPDLVILSSNISGHVKLYKSLNASGITTFYFSVEVFEDYLNMLKICTDITGRSELYTQNGSEIQDKINEIISRTEDKQSPKVLLLRASSGKVAVRNSDTMTGAMLKDMGCLNIADSETGLLDSLSMEIIIRQDPDFIFVTTMGESEEKTQKALQDVLLSNPAWANLSAVKNSRYITLPKDLFHQKPNNRWAEAYEKLWEILYEGK